MTTERMIKAVEVVADKHKNDFVHTCQTNITNMCRDIIPKLELLAGYEAIGSVAECQEAVEKQRAKKPVLNKKSSVLFCPVCERKVRRNYDLYCSGCGQDIDWSDE